LNIYTEKYHFSFALYCNFSIMLDSFERVNQGKNKVVMLADGDDVKIGSPLVAGAKVNATVLSHGKGDKVMIFKFNRRKHYRKTQGHRQSYTEIQIDDINGKGAAKKPAAKAAAPKAAARCKKTCSS